MVRSSTWPVGLLFSAALALAGIAAAQQKPAKELDLAAALERVPPAASQRTNPFAGNEEALGAGRKLFKHHCAECHGNDGQGSEKAPALRGGVLAQAKPGDLFWIVKNGNLWRGMPSWSKLPDAQLWQIVTYLDTLHSEVPPTAGDTRPAERP
jgi:mono/diheme cytochrome c family protein